MPLHRRTTIQGCSVLGCLMAICSTLISYSICAADSVSSTGLPVQVLKASAPARLALGNPSAQPSGIPPNIAAEVTFYVIAGGTFPSPSFLSLDEIDSKGVLVREEVTILRDDGKGADRMAGDWIFSGTYVIRSDQATEGEKYYRARAKHSGEVVTSGSMIFGVTSFPRIPRLSDRAALVKDPRSEYRLFSNEVIIMLRPGVSADPNRIKTIAAAVDGIVVGVIPPVRQYLLQIPGDGTAAGVQEAITTLLTFENEVERAYPNHEVKDQGVPSEAAVNCMPPPPAPETQNCLWHIKHVGVDKAWQIAGGGFQSVNVSVLEPSGIDGDNSDDLKNQCQQGTGGLSNACSASYPHGTWVAGPLGAEAGNNGIVGVAWGTKMFALKYDGSTYTLGMAIIAADQKILNISGNVNTNIQSNVETAISNHRLIVAAAGDVGSTCLADNNKYPAAYNQNSVWKSTHKLLAVGATDSSNNLAVWGSCSNCCSNSADWIDIYAPGRNIYTTVLLNSYDHVSGTLAWPRRSSPGRRHLSGH